MLLVLTGCDISGAIDPVVSRRDRSKAAQLKADTAVELQRRHWIEVLRSYVAEVALCPDRVEIDTEGPSGTNKPGFGQQSATAITCAAGESEIDQTQIREIENAATPNHCQSFAAFRVCFESEVIGYAAAPRARKRHRPVIIADGCIVQSNEAAPKGPGLQA